jgi:cyclic beta-1,2-glucan synthetase
MSERALHARPSATWPALTLAGALIATAVIVAAGLAKLSPAEAAGLSVAAFLALRTGSGERAPFLAALGDAAITLALLALSTPLLTAALPEPLRAVILPLPWGGGVFAVALYMAATAMSAAVRGRGLDGIERAGFLTLVIAVTSVLALGRPPFSGDAVLRFLLLLAVAELVIGMVGLMLRRHWPRALALHATIAAAAALAALGRPVADLPSLIADAGAAVPAAIAAASLAQAGLWAFVYLMTGVLLDGLSGRAPVARALIAHARAGFTKGAIFGGVFMAVVIAAAFAAGSAPQHLPAAVAALFGALLFPLARVILESSDETAPFVRRLAASYRDPRAYVRGGIAGAGLALFAAAGLAAEGPWQRFAAMFALGALAFGGVDLLADLAAIARRRRQRLQTPRWYLLGAGLGGMLAGALGWYFDQSQLATVTAKLLSYGDLRHDNASPYAFQVFFNKWSTVDLGPVTGGVRLFYDESLSGVINWSIAAPLFSLNMVALEALFRRSLDPVRALVRADGVRGVVEQTVRVLRWGLWMAPIIFTFLRMSPDPSWYNQDGLVRSALATGASLTMPEQDFRAWSLAVFTGLLAYDWLRVLIWFDHMGLRVATLVNLSFTGGDRLDEWAGRALGHAATTRVIPPAIRRFMTWAPLIVPFYIPRGAEWDTAWTGAEQLAVAGGPLPSAVAHLAIAYGVAGVLAAAGVVWLTAALKRGRPLPEDHRHVLSNGLYEVVATDDGRTHARVTGVGRAGQGVDLSRPADDPLDPAARGLSLEDRDTGARWPLGRTQAGARVVWADIGTLRSRQHADGVAVEIDTSLASEAALERRVVRLVNGGDAPRRLRLVSRQSLVLNEGGAWRRDGPFNALHIETTFVPALNAIVATNALLSAKGRRISGEAMVHALAPGPGVTLAGYQDSSEAASAGVLRDAADAGALHTFNPCAILAADVDLSPGEGVAITFLDAHAESREAALAMIARETGAAAPAPPAVRRTLWTDHRPSSHRFAADGALVTAGARARAWPHVMANRFGYGAVADSSGFVASFARNARHHTLTPFGFEGFPAAAPGQSIAVIDLDTGETATLLPLAGQPRATFAPGTAELNSEAVGLALSLAIAVLDDAPGEVRRIVLRDTAGRARRLRVSLALKMVLAEYPGESAGDLDVDAAGGVITAVNRKNAFASGVAVAACDLEGAALETVYARFCGPGGMAMPGMLVTGRPAGAARDDGRRVAAFVGEVAIPAHGEREIVMAVGFLPSRDDALAFARTQLRPAVAASAAARTRAAWRERLDGVQVVTNDPDFDRLVNLWLPYQVLAARLWGRTGASQRGGAFGFRDQLQDIEPVTLIDPAIARRQIVLSSAQQFAEGDVLKWWHADAEGRTLFGQRTRACDPHLWLPKAVIAYVRATGDRAVLEEETPFLEGVAIPEGEEGMFFSPRPSNDAATVRDHCRLAIARALGHLAPDGLPLLGSGDWDDGYDAAGRKGRGTSVWMAFFLHRLLIDAADTLSLSPADAAAWAAPAARLRAAVQAAWTGDHFVRAFDDRGRPFGGVHALACAWPALSGAVDFDQARTAAETGLAGLAEPRLVRLLAPPFPQNADPWPGRVARYPEGVRENGGQYSHGSSWLIDAFTRLALEADAAGDGAEASRLAARAADLWWTISPLSRLDAEALARLALPPHQQPADVFAGPPHDGRGGWAWYTGSAARMLTAAHGLLGLSLRDGVIATRKMPANGRFALQEIRRGPANG